MTPRHILIVGPSGSGKSSIGRMLAEQLNVALFSMDDYRIRSVRKPSFVLHEGQQVRNYEDPALWDGAALGCILGARANRREGFVAEGNHLLIYPTIAVLDTECYYVECPFDVCMARRKTRNRGTAADQAYQLIGRQMTERYVAPQFELPGVVVLNGQLPVEENVRQIVERV